MAAALVLTCLPCGWRTGFLRNQSYPLRCPNCGHGKLEHFQTTLGRRELRQLHSDGSRVHVMQRPRLVIGAPA